MRQLLLVAALLLPLGLDTFAVAAALGVAGLQAGDWLRVALVFTAFEAGMPILGLLAGQLAGRLIGAWAGYVGAVLLLLAGGLLLRPEKDEAPGAGRLELLSNARGVSILALGLSISLDELTVGLSAGLLGLPLAPALIWIAVQAFVAAQSGLRLGGRVGARFRERSEQAAGIALVTVALVLLALLLLKL